MRLVLGSASPRRKALLSELGFEFRVLTADADESFDPALSPEELVLSICRKKIAAIWPQINDDEKLICADTVVYLNGEILGKPTNKAAAIEMLQKLSGQTHEVYTGVVIKDTSGEHQLVDCTTVRFQELKLEDIIHYIEEHQAMDKAGAYGIQDWIGHIGIVEIRGSYTNVMGLPTQRLYPFLKNLS
ncbi:MAG: septum formation protein Maf [Bacteroidota bacterium]|jgi:septum formation protein